MAIFDKQKVAIAADKRSKVDLSCNHITTSNFMQLQPVNYRHMVPGEHYKGKMSVLTRLAPVAVPTYGRCRINLRSYFVPFSYCFPNFNEMLTDSVASNFSNSSLVAEAPKFLVGDLQNMFLNYSYGGDALSQVENNATAPYDFDAGGVHYVFTSRGRRYYKILRSLGYQLITFAKNSAPTKYFSALPLLCFAKVYLDYYSNRAYANAANYLFLQKIFHYNDPTATLVLSANDIGDILSNIELVCYDDSNTVYLNAWDNPVAPASGNFSSFSINDVSYPSSGSASTAVGPLSNGTPMMYQNDPDAANIGTQFIHDALQSMTDFFKRNQLSGSYAAERFLSRYGMTLNNSNLKKSYYISSASVDVDFGSVMQTADTSPAGSPSNLGDYSGVGFGKGSLEIDFTAEEFGMLIVCASIVPASDFVQGFDRNLLHIGKESFFIPEYDQLGCDSISKGEVYVSRHTSFAVNPDDYIDGIYGFAPRYYEYKQARSFLTGDFTCPPAMVGGDAWHLFRLFEDSNFLSNSILNLGHGLAITLGVDKNQYDRIFQYTNSDIDKFYLVFHTDAMSLAPFKSLYDTFDFESTGKVITTSGNSAAAN